MRCVIFLWLKLYWRSIGLYRPDSHSLALFNFVNVCPHAGQTTGRFLNAAIYAARLRPVLFCGCSFALPPKTVLGDSTGVSVQPRLRPLAFSNAALLSLVSIMLLRNGLLRNRYCCVTQADFRGIF